MVLKLGYDNTEFDQTFYITHVNQNWHKFISKITNQFGINKKLEVQFNTTKSPYSLKYAFKFNNLFFYRINKNYNLNNFFDILSFDIEIAQKKKMIKLINFDILPVVKFSINNDSEKFPCSLDFKFGNYQASRIQYYDTNRNYDFSKVIKSMLPYFRTGVSLNTHQSNNLNLWDRDVHLIYKASAAINRIHNYEDNIKLSTTIKTLFDLCSLYRNKFTIGFTNELIIKKSFIRENMLEFQKLIKEENIKHSNREYSQHHVLSGYECHSKLVGINFLNTETLIENGSNFHIHNVSVFRLKNIPYLSGEVLSRIEPFFGFETLFIPEFKQQIFDFKKSFRLVYSLGISLRLTDYMYVDFSIYTSSKNTKFKKDLLNRFRINLDISTSI
jgi:hypothetical protein